LTSVIALIHPWRRADVIAVFDGNVGLEGLLYFGAEGGEVEGPPSREFLVERSAGRGEIGLDALGRFQGEPDRSPQEVRA
jgi:hypothetical protein